MIFSMPTSENSHKWYLLINSLHSIVVILSRSHATLGALKLSSTVYLSFHFLLVLLNNEKLLPSVVPPAKKQPIYLFIYLFIYLCLIHIYKSNNCATDNYIRVETECISREPVVIVPSVLRCTGMYISIQPPFHSWQFTAFCGYS